MSCTGVAGGHRRRWDSCRRQKAPAPSWTALSWPFVPPVHVPARRGRQLVLHYPPMCGPSIQGRASKGRTRTCRRAATAARPGRCVGRGRRRDAGAGRPAAARHRCRCRGRCLTRSTTRRRPAGRQTEGHAAAGPPAPETLRRLAHAVAAHRGGRPVTTPPSSSPNGPRRLSSAPCPDRTRAQRPGWLHQKARWIQPAAYTWGAVSLIRVRIHLAHMVARSWHSVAVSRRCGSRTARVACSRMTQASSVACAAR
jgi:hypothetical protein